MRLEPLEVLHETQTPQFVLKGRYASEQAARKAKRGAKREGLKYEERAHAQIDRLCQTSTRVCAYIASPWFRYRLCSSPKVWNYCQPDGLVLAPNDGLVFVLEIKLRHTSDAYFQLLDQYLPLMGKFFGPLWTLVPVEVCKWYDPFVAFPCKPVMRENLLDSRPNEFSIHRWKDER